MARGKGKRGGGRGSGKRFAAQSAEEIEERNRRLAAFDEQRAKHRAETAEDGNDGDGDDNEMNDAEREAMLVGMRVARMNMGGNEEDEEYKKERKPKGLEGIIEIDNPNTQRGSGMLKIKDLASGVAPEQMTRKQREEAEKAAKAAAYRKRHEMGLTEEYKRDMAKLNEVRKRRELSEAKAKAQKDFENSLEEERKKKAKEAGATVDDSEDKKKKSSKKKSKDNDIPKLDKIAIKKMKPAKLKESLKARGLDIQGNAKTLTERLLEYESAR